MSTRLKNELKRLKEDYAALADLFVNEPGAYRGVFQVQGVASRRLEVNNPEDAVDYNPERWRRHVMIPRSPLAVKEEDRHRSMWHDANGNFLWWTNDGQLLYPHEMEESHLRNTISYLCRRLLRDMASTRFVSSLEYGAEALYQMLREADRRGIKV